VSGLSTNPRVRRLHAEALGCKVSRVDAGWSAAPFPRAGSSAVADVLLVHGCAVTDRALRDGRRLVRRLRRENPDATLVVSGCLAEGDADALAAMREVDLVVPLAARADLPALLDARDAGLLRGKVARAEETREAALFAMPARGQAAAAFLDADRTRAFLKIQDGCRRRCAFCIVPSLRGRERSAAREDVANAVRRLGEAGIPEVVLTGIHLLGRALPALRNVSRGRAPGRLVRAAALGVALAVGAAGSVAVLGAAGDWTSDLARHRPPAGFGDAAGDHR